MQHPAFSSPAALAPRSHHAWACPALAPRRPFSGAALARRALLPQPRPQPPAPAIVAFDDSDDEDSLIELRDFSTGRTLSCGVEHAVPHDGATYLLCYPVDDAVAFARVDDDSGELVALAEQAHIDRIFPDAEAVLAEDNVVLRNSAFVLTVDDHSEIEEEEEMGDDGGEDDQQVEVLAEFVSEGEEFLIVKPVFPVLLIARQEEYGFTVLEGDEFERISPIVDDYMDRVMEDDVE